MTVQSWHDGLTSLRRRHDMADAQAQAAILAGASHRWARSVDARVGRYKTCFVLPGDREPFNQGVTLEVAASGQVDLTWFDQQASTTEKTDLDHVAGLLDALLERLTSPLLTCAACGERVLVSAASFAVFERMHWTCFHDEFEHGPFDRDEECRSPGCPSAAVDPWHHVDDPRDALVGQLLVELHSGDLAAEAFVSQVEREGPGVIVARFDEDRYLVTVRRMANGPTEDRGGSDRV